MRKIDRRSVLALSFAVTVALAASDGGAQGIGQSISDSMITVKLKAQISSYLGPNFVNVEVKNGVVMLTGNAQTRLAVQRVEQLAWAIEGVKAVQNELTPR